MIELKQIWKCYEQDWLFRDFSLAFPKGKVSALIGPSGRGKTTLLRILAGLEECERGTVAGIEGHRIAMVFQEDRLLSWLTSAENIELVLRSSMSADQARQKARQVLAMLDLEQTADQLPEALSGGMRRRVAIGRALAWEGDILLMDEPFKGMDEALKQEVLPRLARTWQAAGTTVILVTHDRIDALRLAQHTVDLGSLSGAGGPVVTRRTLSE